MKEKISCSLDGELLAWLDDVIKKYPFIGNRSAVIETACYLFVDLYDQWGIYDLTERTTFGRESQKRDDFIRRVYESRCMMNAATESENRNV